MGMQHAGGHDMEYTVSACVGLHMFAVRRFVCVIWRELVCVLFARSSHTQANPHAITHSYTHPCIHSFNSTRCLHVTTPFCAPRPTPCAPPPKYRTLNHTHPFMPISLPPRTPPHPPQPHRPSSLPHHRTFAKRDLQWSLIAVLQSPPSTALPPPSANTSTHTGLSSHFGCGCATTAHAATEGSATICFSKSIDDIHSPPDLITSFERSRMIRFPPASIDAMSPVASHPPCGNSPRSDLK